jgi:hypothetical protein
VSELLKVTVRDIFEWYRKKFKIKACAIPKAGARQRRALTKGLRETMNASKLMASKNFWTAKQNVQDQGAQNTEEYSVLFVRVCPQCVSRKF